MNAKSKALIKAKVGKKFEDNPFAKKMKDTNDAREHGARASAIEKHMHPAIKRK